MTNTKAIGRRRRALSRANDRAQRRFHAAIDAGVIFDETATATTLYVEAERLIDAILAPDEHPTPVAVLLSSLGFPVVEILSRDDEGFEAIVRRPAPVGSFSYDATTSAKLDEYWNKGA